MQVYCSISMSSDTDWRNISDTKFADQVIAHTSKAASENAHSLMGVAERPIAL